MDYICECCGKELNKEFNFCPYCSRAISEEAKKLEDTKMINAGLVMIAGILPSIEDEKSLKVLRDYMNKVGKK